MKKLLLVWFLFISSGCLTAELLFRSNSIGMPLEKISSYRQDNFEYVLRIDDEVPDTRVKILMKEGKEYRKWVEQTTDGGRSVTIFEEEKKTEETVFSDGGRIERIINFSGTEEIEEELVYHYSNGELTYIRALDAAGEELYRIEYSMGKYGRLRKMQRTYPEQTSESFYTFGTDSVSAEWHGRGDRGDLFRFEKEQQLSALENWKDLEKTAERNYSYDSGTVEYSVAVDYSANIVTKTWYNRKGLEERSLRESGGMLIAEKVYKYNEENDVLEKRVWTPGTRERWEYTYSAPKEQDEEMYYKNGILVSKTEYVDDSTYYEYLYRQGKPFLKITYVDDKEVEKELMIGSGGGADEER